MLKCLLIDDEPLALQLLQDYVAQTPGLELAGSYTHGLEALQALEDKEVDLLFLDVQMPDLTGIQLSRILQDRYPIILTTAYEQYALEGYELNIVDYLLKPITLDRFLKAVQKARQRLSPSANPKAAPSDPLSFLFVKSEYKTVKIALDDVLYLESMDDYVRIHTQIERIMTLERLKYFESSLPPERFMRIHRSYLIALDKIDYIERNRVIIQDARLPIGGAYQEAFWKRIRLDS